MWTNASKTFNIVFWLCFQCANMESVSAANTHFSLNVFQKISEGNPSTNVFYSPLSVSAALSMLSLGAAGNTAAQMCQVMMMMMTTTAAVINSQKSERWNKVYRSMWTDQCCICSWAMFFSMCLLTGLLVSSWVCLFLYFEISHKGPLIVTKASFCNSLAHSLLFCNISKSFALGVRREIESTVFYIELL